MRALRVLRAGLVLGLSEALMLGKPIGSFLPLGGKPTSDLLENKQVGGAGRGLAVAGGGQ